MFQGPLFVAAVEQKLPYWNLIPTLQREFDKTKWGAGDVQEWVMENDLFMSLLLKLSGYQAAIQYGENVEENGEIWREAIQPSATQADAQSIIDAPDHIGAVGDIYRRITNEYYTKMFGRILESRSPPEQKATEINKPQENLPREGRPESAPLPTKKKS